MTQTGICRGFVFLLVCRGIIFSKSHQWNYAGSFVIERANYYFSSPP
jgi:hypothetical protein